MTKKDFEAIAAIIAKAHEDNVNSKNPYSPICDITVALTRYFRTANPRFNADTFIRACWPDSLCRYCGQPTYTHTDTKLAHCEARRAEFDGAVNPRG